VASAGFFILRIILQGIVRVCKDLFREINKGDFTDLGGFDGVRLNPRQPDRGAGAAGGASASGASGGPVAVDAHGSRVVQVAEREEALPTPARPSLARSLSSSTLHTPAGRLHARRGHSTYVPLDVGLDVGQPRQGDQPERHHEGDWEPSVPRAVHPSRDDGRPGHWHPRDIGEEDLAHFRRMLVAVLGGVVPPSSAGSTSPAYPPHALSAGSERRRLAGSTPGSAIDSDSSSESRSDSGAMGASAPFDTGQGVGFTVTRALGGTASTNATGSTSGYQGGEDAFRVSPPASGSLAGWDAGTSPHAGAPSTPQGQRARSTSPATTAARRRAAGQSLAALDGPARGVMNVGPAGGASLRAPPVGTTAGSDSVTVPLNLD
jgi:hypothetical protein